MEIKHKVFVGINTLEDLALDRSKYFDKERHQQTDEWWIGKCFGSRDAWDFIGATLKAKGESIMPAFIAECYMMSKDKEAAPDLDDNSAGYYSGQKDVYKAALRAIGNEDLINLVDDGKYDPEQYMAATLGR